MTPEQDKLCVECIALTGDDKVAFAAEHGLDLRDVWQYEQEHKKSKRAGNKQRRITHYAQDGLCALCKETLVDQIRIDHATGKLMHAGCQLAVANLRKLTTAGIALERIAKFIQVSKSTDTPIAPAALAQADTFDPLDPSAPEL